MEFSKLEREPFVRIGLIRNASSVGISTTDSSLIAYQSGSTQLLETANVRVSLRSYRPPAFKTYWSEIPYIKTREKAHELANKIRLKMNLSSVILKGKTSKTWRLRIGEEMDIRSEAVELINMLKKEGFKSVQIATEKYSVPSDEAIALTRQISANPKSKVRSLISSRLINGEVISTLVTKTALSRSVRNRNKNAYINPTLREVVVSGVSQRAKFSSLKPITIGSINSRKFVRLNGKRYRGKMEVFVNSKGRITVVNVVPMEQYLLGVVPSELSLPQLEAQKAQAVAARTYAIANKNGYEDEGFDMLPTVWSQVYKGVGIETEMGSQAVRETKGIIATYQGVPINALYTSTCGGRTEDSGNIFKFNEPYLRGVNCSLEGREHFTPFLVKSSREPALIRNETNYEYVRLASKMAVNDFLMATERFDDDYFEDAPTQTELRSWINQVAVKFKKPLPTVDGDSSKPLNLARILYKIIYSQTAEEHADTLLSESDINYQLSFLDAEEVPKKDRSLLTELMRDGWFSIYSDLTIKPNKPYSRGKILRLIEGIFNKKEWSLSFETGTAKPAGDGKLILHAGRTKKKINVNPAVFLFRKFGDAFYQVREAALVGGEKVIYKTNSLGEVIYLAIDPIDKTTVAERTSPFTMWRQNISASTLRARLGRYVKGLGTLVDVKVKNKGFSRRAIELEIVTTRGVHLLKGGKIRSALRLREQLFTVNKRYGSNGHVINYSFKGRGWGHGVGMCQYGAYGFAQMGLKYDRIVKHYYSGIELTKAY